jgi:hypothetical protein
VQRCIIVEETKISNTNGAGRAVKAFDSSSNGEILTGSNPVPHIELLLKSNMVLIMVLIQSKNQSGDIV